MLVPIPVMRAMTMMQACAGDGLRLSVDHVSYRVIDDIQRLEVRGLPSVFGSQDYIDVLLSSQLGRFIEPRWHHHQISLYSFIHQWPAIQSGQPNFSSHLINGFGHSAK